MQPLALGSNFFCSSAHFFYFGDEKFNCEFKISGYG